VIELPMGFRSAYHSRPNGGASLIGAVGIAFVRRHFLECMNSGSDPVEENHLTLIRKPGRRNALFDHAVDVSFAKAEFLVEREVLVRTGGVEELWVIRVDADGDPALEVGSRGMARNGGDDSCPEIRKHAKFERDLVLSEVVYKGGILDRAGGVTDTVYPEST
jgi:hypothetical protein